MRLSKSEHQGCFSCLLKNSSISIGFVRTSSALKPHLSSGTSIPLPSPAFSYLGLGCKPTVHSLCSAQSLVPSAAAPNVAPTCPWTWFATHLGPWMGLLPALGAVHPAGVLQHCPISEGTACPSVTQPTPLT